jgi:outer membrane receptor protein involved in Fe transport
MTARVLRRRARLAVRLTAAVVVGAGTAAVARGQAAPPAARDRAARDSAARRDSGAVHLAPVEVRTSIAPTAGVTVGSDVPARVSTVAGETVRAWQPRLLPDVLGTQPGVSFYDDLGAPRKLTLSTRGFTVGPTVGLPPGVSVFVDGVRQNEPDAQEVNFDLLPLEHVERVELLSGSASLLGANSLGGAVNLVTRRGAGPASGALELSGGSFGAAGAEGHVAGRTAGRTDYYAGGGYEREAGWRDATHGRSFDGFVNLGRTGARRGLSVQAFARDSRAATAGSLPETLFDAAPRSNFTAGDFEDLNAEQLAVSGHAPALGGRGTLSLYARRSAAERFNVNQAPDPNVRSRTLDLTAGGTADWRWARAAGPGAFALRLGVDGAANRVRARINAEPNAAVDDAGGDDDAPALTTDVRSPSWDLAGYALADYRVGRLTLSGGGRYDATRVPFDNRVRPADNSTDTFRRLSPRVGASVALGAGASLYASAGGSFRAPAILELGCADPAATCPLPFALGDDPPLRPVRATTYEAGARWARGPLVAGASVYDAEVRDEIFFVASDVALLSGYFTNLDRTRRRGVELGLDGAAGSALTWYANYAYTRATFESPVTLFSIRADGDFAGSPLAGTNAVRAGSRLPLVPAHQAKAGALLRLPGGVGLGLDARRIGAQWLRGDEANETAPLSAYTLVNARASYGWRAWEIAAVVTNALDSHAAIFGTFNENRRTDDLERFLTPMNARALRLTVSRGFGARADDADR